ncbi:MAG: indole-3-glycerol-phosphate synthase [Euryarchaeota archaeon]|nr:indole-3-glycerol-phosphate synthase [Euryarchaeota archaeon]
MLDQILPRVRKEVARRKKRDPDLSTRLTPIQDFRKAIEQSRTRPALIAEIKPRSPSEGAFATGLTVAARAREYKTGGASAISILTEPHFFGGHLENLVQARQEVALPLLQKDFILDPLQLEEAYAYEADAVLLMVSVLGEKTGEFLDTARAHGLQALVEVHNEQELDTARSAGATLIGINNRDMKSLQVDLATTLRLAPRIPPGALLVCESGIKTREDVRRVVQAGARAVLVGTTLMKTTRPSEILRGLAL